ncbi:NACHT, LRR and PYD domains-containing protein 12-like [Petaurus breviceps papuanus]|uniref:NACHT, LRR and PYD domains-containing protein 12-like n=1 Tax=Petaurus breviceps papuanus TaxID=3040969 RepID=UPI0036D86862
MAETVSCRLARHLERLTSEELKKFNLSVVGSVPQGRLEGADCTEVAELLVICLGERKAWEVALSIWEEMGLKNLWERARKEDLGLIPAPVLPASSDERTNYQEQMRKKFQFMRDESSCSGEHELFHHCFTQLLLLEYKKEKKHELPFRGLKPAKFLQERAWLREVSSLFVPFQYRGTQSHTVVLQGAAGIGKTTLAIKIMLDWTKGKLYQKQFNHVFYLSCRELNLLGEREMSFANLIASDWLGPQAPMREIMSRPKKLLFIIDGLDELKFPCNEHEYDLCKDWKQQRPVPILLSSLLRKTLLPEASLLLTTRLTALGKFSPLLENPRHVEILGFSVEQRKEYFCKFFRDEDLGKKAFSLVEGNDTLFTMCSVPLMNWIVCTCLKQQMKKRLNPIQTLKTTTALYVCYLSNLVTTDDHNFTPQHLRGLCRLAAEGIWERKLLFEEEDLRRHDLEAAVVSAFLDMNIFQKDSDSEKCYSFIHLSFQEFFAAMFYLMSTDKEGGKSPADFSIPDVKKLLNECRWHNGSFVALLVRFLFGFLNAETARELERKFRCRVSPEIKSQLLQWAQGETKRKHEEYFSFKTLFPEYLSNLYETQDAELVTQALYNIQEIKVNIRYQYEVPTVVYCIKHCPGAQRLSVSYFRFDLILPAGVWQDFSSVISNYQNLKELQLAYIYFADPCMENCFVGLRDPNCKLEKLMRKKGCDLITKNEMTTFSDYIFSHSLRHCFHSPTYFQNLFSALNSNESLKDLDLSGNFIEEEAMKLLCVGLEDKNCRLEKLSLQHCFLSPTSSQNLFSALNSNESLKDLDLSGNFIKEEAMKLLCVGLEDQNCRLEKLSLQHCFHSPTCSQNLFSALDSNESLKDLDLSGNFIEEKAMKLLCVALEDQTCSLEKLSLRHCFLSPTCSQNLFSALNSNESLKDLDLSGNFIKEEAMKLLCVGLEDQNCRLEKLSLAFCCLTSACYQNLFSALSSNKSLKDLDLSGNFLEEGEINRLSMALGSQNSKLEQLGEILETFPDLSMKEEERRNSPQGHLRSRLGEVAPQTKPEVTSSLSPFDHLEDEQLDMTRCQNYFLGPNGPVKLDLIDKSRNIYRVHLPMAGFYHWPDTGLGFSVRSEVIVDIEFGTWNQHLDWIQNQSWMIAGPLFHIRVDPGVVTSVHLPHFVSLKGHVDVSLFKIAHFKEESLVLENPTRVESFHAILENPTFSPVGVLLRIMRSNFKASIRSTTLIYYQLRAEDVTLHLYLIPSDCSIKQAIDEEEAKFRFLRLHKPSPITPLRIGSRFLVSGSKHLEIMPAELELCYQSPGKCQLFSEIYYSNVREKISLDLRYPNGKLVWKTLVRLGDLKYAFPSAPDASAFTGLHFIDQHRDQIISRVTSVDMILDKLYSRFLSNEDYERIRAEKTNPDKMRRLFSFSMSWDKTYKDYLYEALKETHPHLVKEIQNT